MDLSGLIRRLVADIKMDRLENFSKSEKSEQRCRKDQCVDRAFLAEYAQRVGDVAAFLRLSRLAEKAAYHPTPPTKHEVLMARKELYALKQLGRQKRMTKHPLNNFEN